MCIWLTQHWAFHLKLCNIMKIKYLHTVGDMCIKMRSVSRIYPHPTLQIRSTRIMRLQFKFDLVKGAISMGSVSEWQGKSQGLDSCERPSNLTKVGSKSSIFHPMWPWISGMTSQKIAHPFYTMPGFVHHFLAMCEFKLELQSENAQFESRSTIFSAVKPWNSTDDLEKQILSCATSSVVRHFIAMCEFKLELRSGNG